MLALLQFLFSRGFSTIYATSCPLFQLHTPAIKAFLVCNPGNPTSMAMDADTRKKLVALIKNSVAYDLGYALGLPGVSAGAWFPLWPEQDRTAAWHCSTPGSSAGRRIGFVQPSPQNRGKNLQLPAEKHFVVGRERFQEHAAHR